MSIVDAFILDILKKERRPVKHQDIVEKGLEDSKLKVPIRTKLQYTRWQGAKLRGSVYHRIAEEIGWKKLNELRYQGTMDHFKEFAETYFQPIIKMLNKMNKNDYLKTYAQVVTIYDYLYGNLDTFDFSDPNKLILNNVHCGEFENYKTAGLVDKLRCVDS